METGLSYRERLSDKQIIRRHSDDVKFAEKRKATEKTLQFQDSLTKPSDTINEPVVEQEQSVAEELTTTNDTCVATERPRRTPRLPIRFRDYVLQ